ncbi:MAG: glycosyltransferase [Protaetiibacter sp.]
MTGARARRALGVIADAAGVSIDGTLRIPHVVTRLEEALDPRDHSWSYLVLAVLRTRIPQPHDVVAFARGWQSDGLAAVIAPEVRRAARGRGPVAVVDGGTLVDVSDTSRSSYTTGIQRVARECVAAWSRRTAVREVRFDPGIGCLRAHRDGNVPIVPFRGRFVLPEIAVERVRSQAIASIARFARGTTLAIGFDCIPMTTAETCGPGMPGAFAHYLSTLSRFDVVVAISSAAGEEFRGWRRMLVGAGLEGPRIEDVELPCVVGEPGEVDVRGELGIEAGEPIVLAVGSHEPRKNHLRVLEACEMLWRRGERFTLVMVGGNAWNTGRFDALLVRLRAAGRPIVTRSAVDDDLVWGLYRASAVSVFVSLNEGFGLPLAESLSAGTPAVTSDFGSMAAIGRGRGALLVDPRSVPEIASALSGILTDPELAARLVAEAASVTDDYGWDDYAVAVLARVPEVTSPPQVGV